MFRRLACRTPLNPGKNPARHGSFSSTPARNLAYRQATVRRGDVFPGYRSRPRSPLWSFEVLCYSCCVVDHRHRPLHILKEWTGVLWDSTTLCEIGLVYQLGHRGRVCPSPDPVVRLMRIFDTTRVQTVKYQLCSCSPSAPSAQQILEAGWLQTASQSEVCETWALRAQFEKLVKDPWKQPCRLMPPLPIGLSCLLLFRACLFVPGMVDGILSFRRNRVVDASVGFDGADPFADVTADRAVYISNDGLRRVDQLLNVGHKKAKLKPTNLDDRFARWVPMDDTDIDKDPEVLSNMDQVSGTGKHKRYESSIRISYIMTRAWLTQTQDDPMSQWRGEKQFFLDETLRREGLGDSINDPECARCGKELHPEGTESQRMFRCRDCGEFIQCLECCLEHHQLSPLHFPEEWHGEFWKKTTLGAIGLVYHVGHGGRFCPAPAPLTRKMVVIDTNGIHTVSFQYCGCSRSRETSNIGLLMRNGWYPASLMDPSTCATFRVLDLFCLLNVVGNVNAHDFMMALERGTDALGSTGIRWLPDRYKAFGRMSRQYAFLQRARRSGRAHDAAGVDATKLGEMMVICWACPYDGRNIPPDWRDVDPKYRFLYMLILALDANFKLKNRIRAHERYDPSLGPGWGAFVEPAAYKEHLKNYVGENDISTCIAFAALLQKDTRLTMGLRASGVGGCVCARHEYANMDYIVMACLAGFALAMLMISYDIACQWKKNMRIRNEKLPEAIRLDVNNVEVQCGLPVWHVSSHETECNNENSLSFLVGVGKSDGEGVERTWADLNPAAFHTKEMGVGNRTDTLEDKIDSHNFLKNLTNGDALRRKLVVAISERTHQVDAFKEVNRTVSKELRATWQGQIDAFVADHSQPNPYVLPRSGAPTEAELRLELKREEEEEVRKGRAPLHSTSATAFLSAGIQLEEAQRRIRAELAGRALVTADRASKIHDRRLAFMAKLTKFRKLQSVFSPGAICTMHADEAKADPDAPEVNAEYVKLYMPSELSAMERDVGCAVGVTALETRLRENQCHNSLVQLRGHLHTKRHLIGFRNTHITGQIKATKARTLIAQVGERAQGSSDKYNQGRAALTRLQGPDYAPHFKILKPADVTLDGEEETSETAARKKLAMIGVGKGARTPRHVPGTSKKLLSWIWSAAGALDDDEKGLHESLRVEWSRAKARKQRWEEEVLILREEMRRVLRYLEWQSGWWSARVLVREEASVALRAGLGAYARRQAHMYAKLKEFFRDEWSQSIGEIARSEVADPLEEGADLVHLFT
ncbi:hypothetical protein B0H13DRAFT_2354000 [Mycena leptocephala]|nr:hypothetical protein B0H13DRAFT_2354000 [Mycena leptocephala]